MKVVKRFKSVCNLNNKIKFDLRFFKKHSCVGILNPKTTYYAILEDDCGNTFPIITDGVTVVRIAERVSYDDSINCIKVVEACLYYKIVDYRTTVSLHLDNLKYLLRSYQKQELYAFAE